MKTQLSTRFFVFCFFSLVFFSGVTLFWGEMPWDEVWKSALLRLHNQTQNWNPLLDERLPRLIVLICTGASLAVSGAVIQSLFHNPLASPSILGICFGGSFAAIFIFVFELEHTHPYALPLAACLGCFITLCIVYSLAKFQEGSLLNNLILTGIAVSTVLTAIQGVTLYLLRDRWQLIQTIMEWEAGSTLDRNWQHVHMQLPLTLVGLLGCWRYREELNILALGEEEAINLGVDVKKVRWHLFLCISLLTGGALAAVGIIAFFGLVLPHIIRRIQGSNHFSFIPACILAGSAVLTTLDVGLRYWTHGNISIGNFSAIIGGVFFLGLLFYPKTLRSCNT